MCVQVISGTLRPGVQKGRTHLFGCTSFRRVGERVRSWALRNNISPRIPLDNPSHVSQREEFVEFQCVCKLVQRIKDSFLGLARWSARVHPPLTVYKHVFNLHQSTSGVSGPCKVS